MDYEKKYNDAISRVKKWREDHPNGYVIDDMLQYIFPELRESEDERIRKKIIDIVKASPFDEEKDVLLDWLEKQKEQPTDAKTELVIKAARRVLNNWLDGTDCPDVSGDFAELEYAIREYDGEEKQKEQKPVEWSDYKDKIDIPYCSSEQEWSEEDERRIDAICELLENTSAIHPNYSHRKLIIWLKSLRPQHKQEVTDEEIEEMVSKRSRSTGTTKSEMGFYRNGIKDAIKRFGLRPSWKPSEEQMVMFRAVINDPNNAGAESCQLALRELYEQLKAL